MSKNVGGAQSSLPHVCWELGLPREAVKITAHLFPQMMGRLWLLRLEQSGRAQVSTARAQALPRKWITEYLPQKQPLTGHCQGKPKGLGWAQGLPLQALKFQTISETILNFSHSPCICRGEGLTSGTPLWPVLPRNNEGMTAIILISKGTEA